MHVDIKNFRGYLLLLLAQSMVGVCIVASKALVEALPVISILITRFTIGFLFLISIHFLLPKKNTTSLKELLPLDWVFIVAQALCAGAFFNILLLLGLQHTNADAAGIITSALPAMVAFFSIIFLKERLTFHTTFCIVFAIVGLIIVNAHALPTNRQNHFFGDMIILCSLVPEAAYYILSKMHQNKLPVFLVSALMNGINIPIFLLFFLAQSQATPLGLLFDNLLLLMIVGIGSALFYVFWFLGCKNVHGTAAGLTTAFMPVSTLTMAYLFLDEKISPTQMIGMLFIIFSIFSNVLQKSKHQTIKTVP